MTSQCDLCPYQLAYQVNKQMIDMVSKEIEIIEKRKAEELQKELLESRILEEK